MVGGAFAREFDLMAVQGHPRSWCQWKAHVWLHISH